MTVSEQGLTCQTLSRVAIDSSGLCYFRESWWGLSYTSDVAYSGSTNSRWTTGPANSDITIHDQSPGTSVCPSELHCTSSNYVEWDNDKGASLYVSGLSLTSVCLRVTNPYSRRLCSNRERLEILARNSLPSGIWWKMKESPRWLCREQSSRSRLRGPVSTSEMNTDKFARIVSGQAE